MGGRLIQKWEKDFVIENYLTMTDKEIANHLCRMTKAIAVLRSKLGLIRALTPKRYTPKERRFILDNYQLINNTDIGRKLKRSGACIACYLKNNGLKRVPNKVLRSSKIVDKKVIRMKYLISICEQTKSPYTKDKCVTELKKLSEL